MRLRLLPAALALTILSAGAARAQLDIDFPDPDFATLQEAIDAVAADPQGGTITVSPGTYAAPLTLRTRVTLRAEETARTILTGGVSAEGGGKLQRFTVTGQPASFSGPLQSLELRNNVFRAIPGVAVSLQGVAGASVENNTFHGNGTALALTGSTGTFRANLFAANGIAVTWDSNPGASLSGNFFDLRAQDVTEETQADRDPLLVAPAEGDFHLRPTSPCIDGFQGSADQGAYGGADADTRPFPVSGLEAEVDPSGTTAQLTWSPNLAYDVAGYRVYFGPTAEYRGTSATVGSSPVVVGLVTTITLTGLPVASEAPATVQGLKAFPRDGGAFLTWEAAAGATGYRVLWGLAGGGLDSAADAGAATSFAVTGLTNGTAYRFAVRSLGGTTHHFAVSAFSGVARAAESVRTQDLAVPVTRQEGELSAEAGATPEGAAGFPELEDRGGCFLRSVPAPLPLPGLLGAAGALAALLGAARLGRRFRAGCATALLLAGLVPGSTQAEGIRWSATAKGGVFVPAEGGWSDHYDRRVMPDWRVGVGLRLGRGLEVGVEAGYRSAEGEVETTPSGQPLGRTLDQTLRVMPAQAYLLYDFRGSEGQLLVPYLGAGYSRYVYRQELEEGPTTRGWQQGYHARGGLKMLLNRADPEAARKARGAFGLHRTYACLEGQYARVDDFGSAEADLGGWSALAGVSLEF